MSLLYISHHDQCAQDMAPLIAALRSKGLSCTSNPAHADVILLYISFAYLVPGSRTIAEASQFMRDPSKLITIAIFARISVSEAKNLAGAEGWDEEGILLKQLTSYMAIDMRHRNLSFDDVAAEVKQAVTDPRGPRGADFNIFLSHAGEDKKFVRVLKKVLDQEQKYKCFLDEASLRPGNWAGETGTAQLKNAAEKARLGVFVLSDRSIQKWWPLHEVNIFLGKGTPIIIVWFQLLREQAEQHFQRLDLPKEAHVFLQHALGNQAACMSIFPPGAWNIINEKDYARHVKEKIDALRLF